MRRTDLCVADVMSKLSALDVLNMDTLGRATVGDVATLLRRLGMPHLLVAEPASLLGPASIRGVISHTQVERQLGTSLPALPIATTFAEIELALACSRTHMAHPASAAAVEPVAGCRRARLPLQRRSQPFGQRRKSIFSFRVANQADSRTSRSNDE